MTPKTYRFYVRSPDGRAIYGFERQEVAAEVALEYGAGAAIVDTLAQAYIPMVQQVVLSDGKKVLVYGAIGGWDTGRFGVDRDLIEGAKRGDAAIVHAFLAKGGSANARDANGGPALHWAVARGNIEAVRLLLGHGADPAASDAAGLTPLALATKKGREDVAELLRASGATG